MSTEKTLLLVACILFLIGLAIIFVLARKRKQREKYIRDKYTADKYVDKKPTK